MFKIFKLKPFIFFVIIIFLLAVLLSYFLTQNPIEVINKSDNTKQTVKWVDFNIPYEALADTMQMDIDSYKSDFHFSWIEMLAYLGTKYGGNFKLYKKSDAEKMMEIIKSGGNIGKAASKYGNFAYYMQAYSAVLDGFVGEYEIEREDENGNKVIEKKYGLKAFSPIAKGYSYNHYDDFGVSRSFGYRRKHLGHDLMGSIGTPVIAVESGYVECVGWNRYGGWRIGIRSFDKKRYYYYAHLRKDHPYNDIYEGKIIKAGDVIGYIGMTGYSDKENVNNINIPHLHYGMQLIFDEAKKDETYEIWIDMYAITKLLEKNRSEVYKEGDEYVRKYDFFDINAEA